MRVNVTALSPQRKDQRQTDNEADFFGRNYTNIAKGQRSRKGKAGKKGKKIRVRFRLLDLPTDLVEEITEGPKHQKRLKTLANLNAGNEYLHEVTIRFLWESVRCTRRSWDALLDGMSGQAGLPTMLLHIQYIHLIDANAEFGLFDSGFWASPISHPDLGHATLGQLVLT